MRKGGKPMKNKVIIRIALILLMIVMSLLVISNITYADNFDFSGFESNTASDTIKTPVKDAVGAILSVVRIVGTGIAIIILAVVAMKYMMAAPSDRADFKKAAIQYVVGAIIVFGASNILTLLIPIIERIAS